MRYITIILVFILAPAMGQFSPVKRALDNLQEGDAIKARDLLVKAIEKDSLDPGIRYAFSRLYDSPSYESSDPDSAYFYIMEARRLFPALDEKELERQKRSGIDSLLLEQQKILLDSQAYAVALRRNSVIGYREFQKKYPTALQIDKAIKLEKDVAYENASELDSRESYKSFLDTYPAAEQIPQARERYEFLVYEEDTRDGKLQTLTSFLRNRPQSPFREEVEEKLFEILTAGNRIRDYQQYFELARSERMREKAADFLYHILRDENRLDDFEEAWYSDSLKLTTSIPQESLYGVWSGEGFNFITAKGATQFDDPMEAIFPKYKCEPLDDDFVITQNTVDKFIHDRRGNVIWSDRVEGIENLGFGLIKITRKEKSGVLHKRGEQLIPYIYDEIKTLGSSFLAVKRNNNWGITTFSGRQVLAINYDEITELNGSVIVKESGKYAIVNRNELRKGADGESPKLVFLYDEFESWPGGKTWVRSGESEALINAESSFDIPLGKQEIVPANGGFLLYGELNSYLNESFEEIVKGWNTIQLLDSFGVATTDKNSILLRPGRKYAKPYDSIELWGKSFSVVTLNEESKVLFSSGSSFSLSGEEKLSLMSNDQAEYLEVTLEDKSLVYNALGELVIDGDYEGLKPVGKDYFVFNEKGRSGLLSSQGEPLLDSEYDAFGSYGEGGVSVLKKGKLGYFNLKDSVWFEPKFSKRIQDAQNGWYIVTTDEGIQLADATGAILEEVFEEVRAWNDSTFIIRSEGQYSIYDPNLMLTRYPGITEVKEDLLIEGAIRIRGIEGYGLLHPTQGEIIPPSYTLLTPVGEMIQAVKYFKDADYYVVAYYNREGEIIYRNGLTPDQYSNIVCQD